MDRKEQTIVKHLASTAALPLCDRGFLKIAGLMGMAVRVVEITIVERIRGLLAKLFGIKSDLREPKNPVMKVKRIMEKEKPAFEQKPLPKEATAPEMPVEKRENPMSNDKEGVSHIVPKSVRQEEPRSSSLNPDTFDLDALCERYAPENRIAAVTLRSAVDDLVNGTGASKESAVSKLVELGEAARPFLEAAAKSFDAGVVDLSLKGLRDIHSPRYADCIAAVLQSPDRAVRLTALRAAKELPEEARRPLYEKALNDPEPQVLRRVLSYLAWSDASFATQKIAVLCDDADDTVKWAALEALMVQRPNDACARIELMLPDLDPIYKRRAVMLLERQAASRNEQSQKAGGSPLIAPPPSTAALREVAIKEGAAAKR